MSLLANSLGRLEQLRKLLLINFISFISLIFKILYKGLSFLSKQQIYKNQQIEILKNIIRLH